MKPSISVKEFLKTLDRFLKGKTSPKENARVIHWIESVDEDVNFDLSDAERNQVKEKIWASLNQKDALRNEKFIPRFSPWLPTGIAASLTFLIATVIYLQVKPDKNLQHPSAIQSDSSSLDEVVNTSEKEKEVVLADGSKIMLKPNSRISYNDVLNEERRIVKLAGEAFFTIAHDKNKPFVVYADHIMTTVLGTSFSIKAPGNGKQISVSVSTGTVSVSSFIDKEPSSNLNAREVILRPNQEAVFDPLQKEITASLVSEPKPVVEISEIRVVFDEEPVANILESIATAYGVEISYDKLILANCKMTTAFSDEGLYERLDIVSKIMGVPYTIEGTRVLFESKVCN
jgi:transmembrane sensor